MSIVRVAASVALVSAGLVVADRVAAEPTTEWTERSSNPEQAVPPTADQVARSVLQIWVSGVDLDTDEKKTWTGSGTVISADGQVLTNAHVAARPGYRVDKIEVAVAESWDQEAVVTYTANLVQADQALDLAIIQLAGSLSGAEYVPGTIPAIRIAESEVHLNDPLVIFGYPGRGGDTITVVNGYVSGSRGDSVLGQGAWIKTDAPISGGNSGGLAVNAAGEMVGVPTKVTGGECEPRDIDDDHDIEAGECMVFGGNLGLVRPVRFAAAMMRAAGGEVVYEQIAAEAPSDFDVSEVEFGRPLFTDVPPETGPQGDAIWLESGSTQLCAWWEYTSMSDGVRWSAIWAVDGVVQQDASQVNEVWSGGENGESWICVEQAEPLAEGIWDLTLNVDDEPIGGGFVGIGDASAPVELTFSNASQDEVCFLYFSPHVSGLWGDDWLGPQQTVPAGESVFVNLPRSTYDVRGLDCQRNSLFEDTQEVMEPMTYTYRG